jgi:hypothetical protein
VLNVKTLRVVSFVERRICVTEVGGLGIGIRGRWFSRLCDLMF